MSEYSQRKIDISLHMDAIDEDIHRVFWLARELEPHMRFRLLGLFLDSDKLTSIGIDELIVAEQDEAKQKMGDRISQVISSVEDVKRRFDEIFQPTYTVANYWSPTNRKSRRSIVHRKPLEAGPHKESLAYAYAFYRMTFYAATLDPPLHSIVQYTAKGIAEDTDATERQRRGLFACYSDGCTMDSYSCFEPNCPHPEETQMRWLCIPRKVQEELLVSLGIDKVINEELLCCDTDEIDKKLCCLLDNRKKNTEQQQSIEWEINDFISSVMRQFKENVGFIDGELKTYLEFAANHLSSLFFGNDAQLQESEGQATDSFLSVEQAAFMVATHLMWKKACPTNYMYLFPVFVSDECCVLTMGQEQRMTSEQELAAARFARSLFNHLLLLDYECDVRKRQLELQEISHLQTYGRLVGHNLPKLAITPALTQIFHIHRHTNNLEASFGTNDEMEHIRERARILTTIFEHNESLLTVLLKSGSAANPFNKDLEPIKINEIFSVCNGLTYLYRDRADACWGNSSIAYDLDCRIKPEKASTKILGHKDYLREIVINLVSNAYDQIRITKIQNPGRAEVVIKWRLEKDCNGLEWLLFSVADKAGGFSEEEYKKINKKQSEIIEASYSKDKGIFNQCLANLIQQSINDAKKEASLNIGLLYCVAYLQTLAWNTEFNRSGSLEIDRKTVDDGACVRVKVPITRPIDSVLY